MTRFHDTWFDVMFDEAIEQLEKDTDRENYLSAKEAKEYGIKLISMQYIIDGKEIKTYEDFE